MTITTAAMWLLLATPKIEVSIGAGVDSNPFELPEDQLAAEAEQKPKTGAFIPLGLGAEWKSPARRIFRAGVKGDFDGAFFGYVGQDPDATEETSASDASMWTATIAAPLLIDPKQSGRSVWHADIGVEPFFSMNRSTYTSRRTGRPFEMDGNTAPATDTIVDLSRRLDTNEFGAKVDGDLSVGSLVDLIVGGRYTTVDYVEDYDGTGDAIDSWDYAETRGDADVYVRPEGFVVAAGYTLRIRDYEERFPRDVDGNKVRLDDAGYEPQVFTTHDVVFKAGIDRDRGRAIVRFRNTRRIDEFSGYQNYGENSVSGDFRLELAPDTELIFDVGYLVRKYDEQRVDYDPQQSLTDRRRITIDTGFEWPAFTKWTRLYVTAGLVSQSSASPLYSFVGFHAATGFRVNWSGRAPRKVGAMPEETP